MLDVTMRLSISKRDFVFKHIKASWYRFAFFALVVLNVK